MNDQIWSWLAGGIGLIGFWFSGKKYWWAWYINIVNQVAWAAFALITGYYAFLITAAVYFLVFSRNAYLWTRDHFKSPSKELEKLRLDKRVKNGEMSINEARSMTGLDSFPIEPSQPIGSIHKDIIDEKMKMMTDRGMIEPRGQYVPADLYPELFKIIGQSYVGDGKVYDGAFRLPDFRDRVHRHRYKLVDGYISKYTYIWECGCGDRHFFNKKEFQEMMVKQVEVLHIRRLDNEFPICELPNDQDVFVVTDFSMDKNAVHCEPCRVVITRWLNTEGPANRDLPWGRIEICNGIANHRHSIPHPKCTIGMPHSSHGI